MANFDIVRAWKDAEYRSNLSEEALALLPQHPAGLVELTDEALDDLIAQGGNAAIADSCGFWSCNKAQ
ncbi:MAG: mersacidin/lichenicidin family type 2 lantibiotic [Ktedonobacteraceae bacterium]